MENCSSVQSLPSQAKATAEFQANSSEAIEVGFAVGMRHDTSDQYGYGGAGQK